MNKDRTHIHTQVAHIEPIDEREATDQARSLAWIESGAPLLRMTLPDVPPMHLVSYFVVMDSASRLILLVDHIKAGLWLPPGGHVEEGETPRQTVEREIVEELGISAAFTTVCADLPFFITATKTRGSHSHTDVSLWYVVAGDSRVQLDYEREAFRGYRWFTFDELALLRPERLDPEFSRFLYKLQSKLALDEARP